MSEKEHGNGFVDRTNESRIMKSGYNCVVETYRRADDIDVYFPELEVRRCNMNYHAFYKGLISPWVNKRSSTCVGNRYMTSCGLEAVVVAYRGCDDVDVMFESIGVLRKHVTLGNLRRGHVNPYPQHEVDHVGETKYQKSCKMDAKIVSWTNTNDICVKFDDGQIREHVVYARFLKGLVNPIPRNERIAKQREDRVGEKAETKDGECIIVKYNDANNVVVRFNDGTEVITTYSNFIKASVRNPNVKCDLKKQSERINSRLQMKSQRWAAVVDYKNASEITVRFDDGVEVRASWAAFNNGLVGHPSDSPAAKKAARIGETRVMNNQLPARVIRYDGRDDIDVEFVDDHVVVKSTSYKQFLAGEIAHPTKRTKKTLSIEEFAIGYYLHRLGFVKIEQGQWLDRGLDKLEIDFYNENYNIAIEYDGEIHAMWDIPERDVKKNQKCKNIGLQLYRLRHYNLPPLSDGNSINYVLQKPKNVQMCRRGIIDCKHELEDILKSNNVPFDEGFIDFNRDIDDIINEYKKACVDYYENKHVGEVAYNKKSNQYMVIVAYRNCKDVDVEFSDKSRRCGVSYSKFLAGNVRHPDYTSENLAKKRLGAINTNNAGLQMVVINYRSAEDIDVLFTIDNAVRYNVRFQEFKIGNLSHPNNLRKTRTKIKNENDGD